MESLMEEVIHKDQYRTSQDAKKTRRVSYY